MIDQGFKTCVIETLKYNATDIRARMKKDHVAELAKSIESSLLLEPIVVNRKTKVVIAGRDRVAAHLLLKKRNIWCHMVDADASEVEAAERAENLYRRQDDRDALLREELAFQEARVKATEQDTPVEEKAEAEPKKRGPKKAAKTKAIEAMAKKAGKSKEAMRKAVSRAQKKAAPPPPKEQGIKGDMKEIKAAIGLVLSPLHAAQKAASKLAGKYGPVMGSGTEAALQRLGQRLEEVVGTVRLLRPREVCGYCKGERLDQGRDCSGCGGAGYLTEGAAAVPESTAEAAE